MSLANRYILKEKDYSETQKPLYVEYRKKRRINTRLVRASWKRVMVTSLVYALALNFCRIVYFEIFGKPTFFDVDGYDVEGGTPVGPLKAKELP